MEINVRKEQLPKVEYFVCVENDQYKGCFSDVNGPFHVQNIAISNLNHCKDKAPNRNWIVVKRSLEVIL